MDDRPLEYDAVLGGNNPPPVDGLVLGGISGLKSRWEKETDIPRKILMLDRAFSYGESGLDLVLDIFKKESGKIKYSAYKLLKQRKEDKVKKAIENYTILSDIDCKFTLKAHSRYVRNIAISPDGKKIVTGSREDRTIKIWDLQTGELQITIETNDLNLWDSYSYLILGITPNGKQIYIMESSYRSHYFDKIICWDLETGKLSTNSLTVSSGKDFPIISSLSGNKILYQCEDKNLELFNLQTERIELTLRYKFNLIGRKIISLDGCVLVDISKLKQIIIGNLETGRKRKFNLKGHLLDLNRIWIALSERTFISDYRNNIYVWDLYSKKIKHIFEGHTDCIYNIKVTPDGKYLISYGADRTIRIWDLYNRKNIRVIENASTDGINSLAISPDGETIVTGSYNGEIKIWGI